MRRRSSSFHTTSTKALPCSCSCLCSLPSHRCIRLRNNTNHTCTHHLPGPVPVCAPCHHTGSSGCAATQITPVHTTSLLLYQFVLLAVTQVHQTAQQVHQTAQQVHQIAQKHKTNLHTPSPRSSSCLCAFLSHRCIRLCKNTKQTCTHLPHHLPDPALP